MSRDDDRVKMYVDQRRRRLIGAGIAVASVVGLGTGATPTRAQRKVAKRHLRWGVVGTGGIANAMAPRINEATGAQLAAVSSRRIEKAREFASKHGAGQSFGDWKDMIASDAIDAVYIATPTSVREEIAIASARAGRHVLGEKPFASLASVQRIAAACRASGVGFMDGTHFVHEPRHRQLSRDLENTVGWPWSVASAFQFRLADTGNIRLQPAAEPYGAIGDTGWYTMKVASEYIRPGVEIAGCEAYMRRHPETGACISGSGVIRFDDGSTSTWNCGFESGGAVQDLRISGEKGVIRMHDFLRSRREDHAGVYELSRGWGEVSEVVVPSEVRGSTRMFEDFALMVTQPEAIEASIASTERAQRWLDAVWQSAVENEGAVAKDE
jgi:predicted dehydrogenase